MFVQEKRLFSRIKTNAGEVRKSLQKSMSLLRSEFICNLMVVSEIRSLLLVS